MGKTACSGQMSGKDRKADVSCQISDIRKELKAKAKKEKKAKLRNSFHLMLVFC